MTDSMQAPGQPGISPTWTSSAKDMVTTALGASRVWATIGFGILNEVYWPSTGAPQIRDLGFIIAGPKGWYEVKRVQRYTLSTLKPHVPLVSVTHRGEGYKLELEYLPAPSRDAMLIRYRLEGDDLRLYPLLAPHLDGNGWDNNAYASGDLVAAKPNIALCLAADGGFARSSAGYVGVSDGWQDFDAHGEMRWQYPQAENGNVALMGELADNSGILALSFSRTLEGARTLARSVLAEDFSSTRQTFIAGWEAWAQTLDVPHVSPELKREAELSALVLKVHEDQTFPGSLVASLSIPWGNSHNDLGGYHLVWTRDAVEAALALVAVGQVDDACRMLAYLIATQQPSGGWSQNYFPDGRPYWTGEQLDEVAFPIVLASKLRSLGALPPASSIAGMVRGAARHILRNGPFSPQDRWEENAGANPFTLAFAVVGLVAATDFLDPDEAEYALSVADCWNERIESLTYVRGGPLCERFGVDGYYVRIAPPDSDGALRGRIAVKNTTDGPVEADELVGLEYLYLVRTGLRQPDDQRITDTLKVTEGLLRVETPSGPSYHRYNGDGYGEHADGAPFDGTGIGRLWPLLTGERGHYAVMSGDNALPYLEAMAHMTGPGGLLPEQIWDRAAIPERGLEPGRPSGSAMPLVWAHAEFIKLLVARDTGRPVELMEGVERRYGGKRPTARTWHWRADAAFQAMPQGRALAIECDEPFVLRYGFDGWKAPADRSATQVPFGMHRVLVTAADLGSHERIDFTLHFPQRNGWAGVDYRIDLEPDDPPSR
ncbi:MAG TPA: glycoside hydrolase family 15 protein [Devosiaceae bacterium]